MPDRAKHILYVQQTCLDVQGSLCTVTPKGKPCTYRPQANWGGQLLLMNWGRKSHFKRIGPTESVGAHPCTCKSLLLQAASVFQGHESRPDRAKGNLYVHGSRSGRAEGALYAQPTCLGVQRILCTVKLPRNSTY